MSTVNSIAKSRGFSNSMTKLLDKIERQLGVKQLNLPDSIGKPAWPDVIVQESLDTFSRYFPRQITYVIDPKTHPKRDDGKYYIDERFCQNMEIIGVQDIAWPFFSQNVGYMHQELGSGIVDYVSQMSGLSFEDISMLQMRADLQSLNNNKYFVEYEPPNMVGIMGRHNLDLSRGLERITIYILVKHDASLLTIAPTKMETFEKLAKCDVARFLYNELKYLDGIDTTFAQIDLKLGDLEKEAEKRDEIEGILKDSYVSASNPACPILMTI